MHTGLKIASKTIKQRVLERHPEIAKHILPTRFFSKEALQSMLNTYKLVYVKPNVGSGGYQVIRVELFKTGKYCFQIGKSIVTAFTFSELYRLLKNRMKKITYIIQKGIQLCTINGNPVDYRVKYIKEAGLWRYRAVVGRVARPGLIVTNLHQGGRQWRGITALKATVGVQAAHHKKAQMKRLTRLGTAHLLRHFPGLTRLGFDYGIDKYGKVWIFEVNTNPD